MDPLSLVTACIGTLAGIAQLTAQINSLTSGFADAKRDLGHVSRELTSIGVCLEALREAPFKDDLPPSLLRKLVAVVTNCDTVCSDITSLLNKLAGGSMLQRLSWTFKQRERADRLRVSLEAHKSALDIALELGAITQLHELQIRTNSIKHDTVALRASFAIVEAMAKQVQAISLHVQRDQDNFRDPVVDAFLADVAAYAKSTLPLGDERYPHVPDPASAKEIARLNDLVKSLEGTQDYLLKNHDDLQRLYMAKERYAAMLWRCLRKYVEQQRRRLGQMQAFTDRHDSQLKSSIGSIALAITIDPNSELGIRRTCMMEYQELHRVMCEDFEAQVMPLAKITGLQSSNSDAAKEVEDQLAALEAQYSPETPDEDLFNPGVWGSERDSGCSDTAETRRKRSSTEEKEDLLHHATCSINRGSATSGNPSREDNSPEVPYEDLHCRGSCDLNDDSSYVGGKSMTKI